MIAFEDTWRDSSPTSEWISSKASSSLCVCPKWPFHQNPLYVEHWIFFLLPKPNHLSTHIYTQLPSLQGIWLLHRITSTNEYFIGRFLFVVGSARSAFCWQTRARDVSNCSRSICVSSFLRFSPIGCVNRRWSEVSICSSNDARKSFVWGAVKLTWRANIKRARELCHVNWDDSISWKIFGWIYASMQLDTAFNMWLARVMTVDAAAFNAFYIHSHAHCIDSVDTKIDIEVLGIGRVRKCARSISQVTSVWNKIVLQRICSMIGLAILRNWLRLECSWQCACARIYIVLSLHLPGSGLWIFFQLTFYYFWYIFSSLCLQGDDDRACRISGKSSDAAVRKHYLPGTFEEQNKYSSNGHAFWFTNLFEIKKKIYTVCSYWNYYVPMNFLHYIRLRESKQTKLETNILAFTIPICLQKFA